MGDIQLGTTQSLAIPDYWREATRALSAHDAVMRGLIAAHPSGAMSSRGQPFYTLMRSIVGQQISVRAADSIWVRVCALCAEMTPVAVLACSTEQLRGAGLSGRKVEYVQAIAVFFRDHNADEAYWQGLDDAAVITELSSIRGVGEWTAQMFLMFTLLRPNVLPTADIGLLRGLERAYGHERLTPKQAHALYFERFSPWASVATWYLWRSLDPVEVTY